MTPVNPDQSIATPTAALLTAPGSSTNASTGSGADTAGRVHRLAGVLHQTIDKIEQGLNARGPDASSLQSKYVEPARQYGEKLRGQINARPLQSAGVAMGAGVILNKVFSGKPRVRVVKVSEPSRSVWDAMPSLDRTARRWSDTANSQMRGLRGAGHEAMGRMSAAADVGMAGTKALASTLTRTVSTLPDQLRTATQRLMAGSQDYGSKARTGMQAHPMAGLGAVAGAGALATTLWLQRRRMTTGDSPYAAVNQKGEAVWQRDSGSQGSAGGMIAARPMTSAAVMLGVGALVGVMLSRR